MCKYHIIVNKSSLKTKENPETHFKETRSNLLNITVNTMALRTRCLFLAARSRQQLLQDCVGSQSQCRALLWTSKVFVVTNRAIIASAVTQHLYVELSESSTKQSFSQTDHCVLCRDCCSGWSLNTISWFQLCTCQLEGADGKSKNPFQQ